MNDIKSVTAEIRTMANAFEKKTLPDYAVGSIEGWCDRIDSMAKAAIIDAAIATQLSRSIARNSRLLAALVQIANKTKMDAVAAVAMRAIACDAVKRNDDAA